MKREDALELKIGKRRMQLKKGNSQFLQLQERIQIDWQAILIRVWFTAALNSVSI